MPPIEIRPFADEHLEDAARLLAERHRRHREAEPLLPAEVDIWAEVEELWSRGGSGLVGLRDGRCVAYVLGTRLTDDVWGPNAWVELAGHAAEEPEDVRDLYAAAAAGWLEEGRRAHYVYVPASNRDLIDAWFRLGFGAQHAFAIRELRDERAVEAPGVIVRRAEERDVEAMVAIGPELAEHHARSPVFSLLPPETPQELRAEIQEDLATPEVGSLVAEVDGRVVGNLVVVPIERSGAHVGLARPPGAAHLGFAATLPEVRGTGAGLALAAAAFAWARSRGYRTMVTDWRITNLLASRFWPRRGFRPTFLRLHRYIG